MSEELGYSKELCEVIAAMLVKEPQARPWLSQVLTEHELVRVTVLQLERSMAWAESLVPQEGKQDVLVPKEAEQKLRELFKRHSTHLSSLRLAVRC